MKDYEIETIRSTNLKQKPNADQIEFGKHYTDHMFIMDYAEGKGWHSPRIVPYAPLELDPAAKAFHYGQTIFEGLKAYRTKDNKIFLFRPDRNFKRLNQSNERIVIPQIDEELALAALIKLVSIDQDWIPSAEGTSLYIRPFIIATEPSLGLAPSNSYKFIIIMSPVGSYYKEGINPVKIAVEEEYIRAAPGGTGEAKTGGNYSSSLIAQEEAEKIGYTQVLWLDGKEKKYVEEVGSMNVFFKINDEIITPALNGSILHGITRDSILQLLRHWNEPVVERKISIDEIYEAHHNGTLEEAFGTGTAAVISPIGELFWKNEKITLNNGEIGTLTKKLYDTLTGIQYGTEPDPFGWIIEVK